MRERLELILANAKRTVFRVEELLSEQQHTMLSPGTDQMHTIVYDINIDGSDYTFYNVGGSDQVIVGARRRLCHIGDSQPSPILPLAKSPIVALGYRVGTGYTVLLWALPSGFSQYTYVTQDTLSETQDVWVYSIGQVLRKLQLESKEVLDAS